MLLSNHAGCGDGDLTCCGCYEWVHTAQQLSVMMENDTEARTRALNLGLLKVLELCLSDPNPARAAAAICVLEGLMKSGRGGEVLQDTELGPSLMCQLIALARGTPCTRPLVQQEALRVLRTTIDVGWQPQGPSQLVEDLMDLMMSPTDGGTRRSATELVLALLTNSSAHHRHHTLTGLVRRLTGLACSECHKLMVRLASWGDEAGPGGGAAPGHGRQMVSLSDGQTETYEAADSIATTSLKEMMGAIIREDLQVEVEDVAGWVLSTVVDLAVCLSQWAPALEGEAYPEGSWVEVYLRMRDDVYDLTLMMIRSWPTAVEEQLLLVMGLVRHLEGTGSSREINLLKHVNTILNGGLEGGEYNQCGVRRQEHL